MSTTETRRPKPAPREPDRAVTDEMLTVAMRAFEQHSAVLRYREVDRWHLCDQIGMRKALEAALTARHLQAVVSVDVQRMDTTRGPDFFVRFQCAGREVTPHVFRERFKAEYEAAHYSWVFGLRPDEPDLLSFDETSHPNEAPPPAPADADGEA